jgi:hypothetical protein
MMHLIHIGRSPAYLTGLVTATADLASRQGLRSADSQRYEIPRTALKFGERAFSFAGPSAWNDLPDEIQEQSDTDIFKGQLKSYLFARAYAS